MLHVVIMAGGGGTRLWPLSTPKRPKQFLAFAGGRSMLSMTLDRVETLAPPEATWIVTMADQKDAVMQEITTFPEKNVLLEPMARNTAAAIGLSAVHILRDDPEAVMAVLPADHLVRNTDAFCESLRAAETVSRETDAIVTLGIQPTRPETGYGYIERGEGEPVHGALPVKRFREKPNRETAEAFLEAGDFYWNGGIFVAKAARLLDELKRHVPQTHETLFRVRDALDRGDADEVEALYASLEAISIDYAVMERADNVRVIPASFDWSDVGGYEELLRLSAEGEGRNATQGEVLLEEVRGSYVRNETDLPLAVVGVENLVVVATEEGLLVTTVSASQHVKRASTWAANRKKK